jgi:hypothetical protein
VNITESKGRSVGIVSVGILPRPKEKVEPKEEHIGDGVTGGCVGELTQVCSMGNDRKWYGFYPGWGRVLFFVSTQLPRKAQI